MTQDIAQNSSDAVNVERDMYEEREEEEMLQECRAEAAKRGDLSLMHSEKIKKSHIRKKKYMLGDSQ